MEKRYRQTERWNFPGSVHMYTCSCFQKQPFLESERTCQWLAQAINKAADAHEVHVLAYVFMPDHLHLLYYPVRDKYDVSLFFGAFKNSVGKRVLAWMRKHRLEELGSLATGQRRSPYRFWQAGGGHDRNTTDHQTILNMVDYIHANPVKAGLALYASDYAWSSARYWETGEESPVFLNDTFLR